MCWPELLAIVPTLIAGGLSAAGTAEGQAEDAANAKRVADARNQVLIDTLNKDTGFANDSRTAFNDRAAQVQPGAVHAQQGDLTGQRTGEINSNMPTITPATFPGAATTSSLVKHSVAGAIHDALAKSEQGAQAQGRLGGYGDVFVRQGLSDADTAQKIGTDVDFTNANNSLTPELQDIAANNAYQPKSPIGAILTGLGSAYGAYAGSHAG